MCQNGPSKWMKCPHEAKRRPTTTEEFLDNLNADDSEQKFCCGDFENRFCCSFAEKLREVPGFDPGTHEDSSVRYRFHHVERFPFGGFLVYLFWFFLIVFIFTAITYIFGCALFEVRISWSKMFWRDDEKKGAQFLWIEVECMSNQMFRLKSMITSSPVLYLMKMIFWKIISTFKKSFI